MNRAKLISQLRSLLGQAEDPHALFAEGAVGQYDNEYSCAQAPQIYIVAIIHIEIKYKIHHQ